jgi:hypothetical protein
VPRAKDGSVYLFRESATPDVLSLAGGQIDVGGKPRISGRKMYEMTPEQAAREQIISEIGVDLVNMKRMPIYLGKPTEHGMPGTPVFTAELSSTRFNLNPDKKGTPEVLEVVKVKSGESALVTPATYDILRAIEGFDVSNLKIKDTGWSKSYLKARDKNYYKRVQEAREGTLTPEELAVDEARRANTEVEARTESLENLGLKEEPELPYRPKEPEVRYPSVRTSTMPSSYALTEDYTRLEAPSPDVLLGEEVEAEEEEEEGEEKPLITEEDLEKFTITEEEVMPTTEEKTVVEVVEEPIIPTSEVEAYLEPTIEEPVIKEPEITLEGTPSEPVPEVTPEPKLEPEPELVPETEIIPETPPPTPVSDKKVSGGQEQKVYPPGTLVWIQGRPFGGAMYKVLPPPYNQADLDSIRETPQGYVDYGYTGKGSAYKSLQVIGGVPPEDVENLDLGWARINIVVEDGKPVIEYVQDEDANVGIKQSEPEETSVVENEPVKPSQGRQLVSSESRLVGEEDMFNVGSMLDASDMLTTGENGIVRRDRSMSNIENYGNQSDSDARRKKKPRTEKSWWESPYYNGNATQSRKKTASVPQRSYLGSEVLPPQIGGNL